MTMRVDVVPFQAMEIAASSPRDLPRFLAGLDDAVLEQVRYYADLVLRAAEASQVQRKFTARWVECGQREPVWPNDTSALLAEAVASATHSMTFPPADPSVPAALEVPAPAPSHDDPLAPDTAAELTAGLPAADQAPAATPQDAASVPDSQDLAQ